MADDLALMRRALRLAARGRGGTSPNPMVGASVVAPDGAIVGDGYHRRAGEAHAEVMALSAAGLRARGATLYCTLEPCCHHGRTGPCVERIVDSGPARVVVAVEDPNPLVSGGGIRYLRERGLEVTVGVAGDEARLLNAAFFTAMIRRRPLVIIKAAASLDGRISAAPGVRTALSSPQSLRVAHALRAEVDAIAIGSGTALADDPLLTAREVYRSRPLTRVVFDRRLRTPPSARLFGTLDAGPVVVATSASASPSHQARRDALRHAGAEVLEVPEGAPGLVLSRLVDRGVHSLLFEGGAALHAALCEAGMIDVVQVYIAPVVLGPLGVPLLNGARLSLTDLDHAAVWPCGPDVVLEGHVHRAR